MYWLWNIIKTTQGGTILIEIFIVYDKGENLGLKCNHSNIVDCNETYFFNWSIVDVQYHVSGVKHNDSVIHAHIYTFFFRCSSLMNYY